MIIQSKRLKDEVHEKCRRYTYEDLHKKIINNFFSGIGSKVLSKIHDLSEFENAGFIGAKSDDDRFPILRLDFNCSLDTIRRIEVHYGRNIFYVLFLFNDHNKGGYYKRNSIHSADMSFCSRSDYLTANTYNAFKDVIDIANAD